VKPQTMLIAEDNPASLHLYEHALSQADLRILTADNGNLMLFELEHEPVDLLVTDTQMPDLASTEWVGPLHEKRPGLPIILVVNKLTDVGWKGAAKEHGIKAFIRKPINLWVLKQIVLEILFPRQLTHR
jgi:DNA-binding NtrC family response regulator